MSEPLWPNQEAKAKAICDDYVNGIDSPDVFRARLHGLGFRGDELRELFNFGSELRLQHECKRVSENAKEVLVLERDGSRNVIRFKDATSAGNAVELLRRQPNVLFACRVQKR